MPRTLPRKVYFPSDEYTRDEFYKTTNNLRYHVKFNLVNGQQASNIPVDIEDLIEFIGDVEILVDQTEGISREYRNHTSWTVKMRAECQYANDIDMYNFESRIECLARDHNLSLQKKIHLSGRGESSKDMRLVNINYSFGTYETNDEELIYSDTNPLTRVEWVGGEFGQKSRLSEKNITVKVGDFSEGSTGLLGKLKKRVF